jgi:hypothetical protein
MITKYPDDIIETKKKLGSITVLNCTQVDTANAHWLLGQEVRAQIHKILTKRLNDQGSAERVTGQIRQARRYRVALKARLQIPRLDEIIKAAIGEYITCLTAWAEGAQLADFQHPFLASKVDNLPVSATDLAMFLQEDETGCQTGVYREQDGSVILWHVEEDDEKISGERFDKLRLFSFRTYNGQIATGFIYPDLLPGPTFAWQGGNFVQAVDTLHVKPVDFDDSILPNTLAWLCLYLGTYTKREELAKHLGPFQGGYSLTATYKKEGQVSVEKIEYANDMVEASTLENSVGCYLFQTNTLRDPSLPIGVQEQASAESRAWNKERYARTSRFMRAVQQSDHTLPLVFRMLQSRLGGDLAYANKSVKAYLVCHMTSQKTLFWVGAGAPMPGDNLFTFEE